MSTGSCCLAKEKGHFGGCSLQLCNTMCCLAENCLSLEYFFCMYKWHFVSCLLCFNQGRRSCPGASCNNNKCIKSIRHSSPDKNDHYGENFLRGIFNVKLVPATCEMSVLTRWCWRKVRQLLLMMVAEECRILWCFGLLSQGRFQTPLPLRRRRRGWSDHPHPGCWSPCGSVPHPPLSPSASWTYDQTWQLKYKRNMVSW